MGPAVCVLPLVAYGCGGDCTRPCRLGGLLIAFEGVLGNNLPGTHDHHMSCIKLPLI